MADVTCAEFVWEMDNTIKCFDEAQVIRVREDNGREIRVEAAKRPEGCKHFVSEPRRPQGHV